MAARATRLSSNSTAIAVRSPISAIGSMPRAANGGYVKPYVVPGTW